MSELDLVRELFPDRVPDGVARERVRAAVAARTFDRRHPTLRLTRVVSALGTAALAAAAAAAFLLAGTTGTTSAAAARLLRQAAATARHGRALVTLGPGQYLYTKSTDEYLNTFALAGGGSYAVIVPHTREIWLRRDGTGWLHQVAGAPRFLSERDRQAWVAAGSPPLDAGSMDTFLQNSDGPTPPMGSLDLPSDPDALYAKLEHDASRFGDRMHAEMFVMIGDDLRENSTTPEQRAALFDAAARIPGITVVHGARDAAGRLADGVAIDDGENRERLSLLFDPQSRALLGEEDSLLAGNPLGYPAGTVIGQAAYLEQTVVDSVPAAVRGAAH